MLHSSKHYIIILFLQVNLRVSKMCMHLGLYCSIWFQREFMNLKLGVIMEKMFAYTPGKSIVHMRYHVFRWMTGRRSSFQSSTIVLKPTLILNLLMSTRFLSCLSIVRNQTRLTALIWDKFWDLCLNLKVVKKNAHLLGLNQV